MVIGIPNYQNLDRTGEAQAAAERMEARAQESASEVMFNELVAPRLDHHGVERREEFERDLGELFDRHAVNGVVEFTYVTTSRMWRFA